nr:MAG TPA_asm: hypothetical protein [Caudoviricetes sp.]
MRRRISHPRFKLGRQKELLKTRSFVQGESRGASSSG